MPIRVIIADDHRMMRDGLRALLAAQPRYEVVAETDNGRDAVRLAREHRPDIVVMDIGMPELNGIDATRQVLEVAPGAKVVAMSMHADSRYVGRMLRAGASAYILKEAAFDDLVEAIVKARAGQVHLSAGITGVVVQDYVRRMERDDESEPGPRLTDREREVLQLMAEGRATKQIAAELSVSVKTIETHRQHIMTKLDLHSIAELTKYAIRTGLTSLGD